MPVVLNYVGLGSIGSTLVNVLRWPLLLALIIVGLAVLYRYGPSRREPRWQWLTVGSVVAAIAWLISSVLLSWYLSNFANYDATYGSLGAAIGLMMWMWISAIVILLGAELNAEIEQHQTAKDSTVHGDKPLGGRGAAMADTVGAPAEQGMMSRSRNHTMGQALTPHVSHVEPSCSAQVRDGRAIKCGNSASCLLLHLNGARFGFLHLRQRHREYPVLELSPDLVLIDATRKAEAPGIVAVVFRVHRPGLLCTIRGQAFPDVVLGDIRATDG